MEHGKKRKRDEHDSDNEQAAKRPRSGSKPQLMRKSSSAELLAGMKHMAQSAGHALQRRASQLKLKRVHAEPESAELSDRDDKSDGEAPSPRTPRRSSRLSLNLTSPGMRNLARHLPFSPLRERDEDAVHWVWEAPPEVESCSIVKASVAPATISLQALADMAVHEAEDSEEEQDVEWRLDEGALAPQEGSLACSLTRTSRHLYATHLHGRGGLVHFTALDAAEGTPIAVSLLSAPPLVTVAVHTREHAACVKVGTFNDHKFPKLDKHFITNVVAPAFSLPTLTGIRSVTEQCAELDDYLLKLEQQEEPTAMKFGVLYVKEGQRHENDMFQNAQGSPAFDNFLALLGDRIALKDWPHYSGGLDTQLDKTGTHSVFARLDGFEVMFHVSTLLPSVPGDEQALDKKRHLGNDVAVVVFLDRTPESDFAYAPHTIRTHFNHVLVLVSPAGEDADGEPCYAVQTCRRSTVPPFVPPTPTSPLCVKASTLRPYLLCKRTSAVRYTGMIAALVINGEHAAYSAPVFEHKMQRTREAILARFLTFN